MDLDEFVEKIKEEFEEDNNIGELDPDTDIKDMDWWSSMHMLIVIALVDTEYDVMLTPDDVRKATSIRSLYDIVKSK